MKINKEKSFKCFERKEGKKVDDKRYNVDRRNQREKLEGEIKEKKERKAVIHKEGIRNEKLK